VRKLIHTVLYARDYHGMLDPMGRPIGWLQALDIAATVTGLRELVPEAERKLRQADT